MAGVILNDEKNVGLVGAKSCFRKGKCEVCLFGGGITEERVQEFAV